jgi:hypothetical protein
MLLVGYMEWIKRLRSLCRFESENLEENGGNPYFRQKHNTKVCFIVQYDDED